MDYVNKNWFSDFMKKKIGDGEDTFFWHDCRVQDDSLKNRFGRLFQLSMHK